MSNIERQQNSFKLLKITAFPQESGIGFITRSLIENSLSWHWLRSVAGITQDTFPKQQHLRLLRLIIGEELDERSLLSRTRMTDGRFRWSIYGHAFVFQSQIQISPPKVCGLCLVQSRFARRVWDLEFISACPIHRVHLVSICAECRLPITWARAALIFCRCGSPYMHTSEQPSSVELQWAKWLSSKLHHSDDEPSDFLPFSLSQIDLGVVIQLCKVLGMASLGIRSLKPNFMAKRYNLNLNSDLIVAGCSALHQLFYQQRISWSKDFNHEISLRLLKLIDFVDTPQSCSLLSQIYQQCFGEKPQAVRGRLSAQLQLEF